MGRRFEGEVNGYFVQAQVFSEPSPYGIAEGRISRLAVYPNPHFTFKEKLIYYERGWDGGVPGKRKIQEVIEITVQYFDKKCVNWSFEARR